MRIYHCVTVISNIILVKMERTASNSRISLGLDSVEYKKCTVDKKIKQLHATDAKQKAEIIELAEKCRVQDSELTNLREELKICKENLEISQRSFKNATALYVEQKRKSSALQVQIMEDGKQFKREIAEVKKQYTEKMKDRQNSYRKKVAELEARIKTDKGKYETNINQVQNWHKDLIQEKDKKIETILKEKEACEIKLDNTVKNYEGDLRKAKNEIDWVYKLDIRDLKNKLDKAKRRELKVHDVVAKMAYDIKTMEKKIKTLEVTIKDQQHTIQDQLDEINILKESLKMVSKKYSDCATKMAILTTLHREVTTNAERDQKKLTEVEELLAKTNSECVLASKKAEYECAKQLRRSQKIKAENQRIQRELQEKKKICQDLRNQNKDFLSAIDGFKKVLHDPRALKKEVIALGAHYLQGDTRVVVNKAAEQINETLIEKMKKQEERAENIANNQRREKQRFNNSLYKTQKVAATCINLYNSVKEQNLENNRANAKTVKIPLSGSSCEGRTRAVLPELHTSVKTEKVARKIPGYEDKPRGIVLPPIDTAKKDKVARKIPIFKSSNVALPPLQGRQVHS